MFDLTPNGKVFFHKKIGTIERVGKYIKALAIVYYLNFLFDKDSWPFNTL